jgi:hypothetical protein
MSAAGEAYNLPNHIFDFTLALRICLSAEINAKTPLHGIIIQI